VGLIGVLGEDIDGADRFRSISSIGLTGQFPTRSQMNFRGLPYNRLRDWKSESFDTITKSCSLAYSQICVSDI
jgi:hypothetical protein